MKGRFTNGRQTSATQLPEELTETLSEHLLAIITTGRAELLV